MCDVICVKYRKTHGFWRFRANIWHDCFGDLEVLRLAWVMLDVFVCNNNLVFFSNCCQRTI